MTATPRQTFALYCATGFDVRNCGLTKDKASFLIGLSYSDKATAIQQVSMLPGAIQKKGASAAPSTPKADYNSIWNEAYQAGIDAGNNAIPTPMTVVGGPGERYFVSEGCCGFAWIVVNPGTNPFARWARQNKQARAEYGGGTCVYWVGEFNQSMTRKEAFAEAFANVLNKYGIPASSRSRMD